MARSYARAAFAVALALAPAAVGAAPVLTPLYSFEGGPDGAGPAGKLIADSHGNLYGTTQNGGLGFGTVFELTPNVAEKVLYSFTAGKDGAFPQGGLLRDGKGELFGGVDVNQTSSIGDLFRLTRGGAFKSLYRFPPSKGVDAPNGDLVEDGAGVLYGTAGGGADAVGVVYSFQPGQGLTVLHIFTGQDGDGSGPFTGLSGDPATLLYGGTLQGGDPNCNCGVVFSITPGGVTTIVHRFTGFPNDGANPADAPLPLADGVLVGVTETGGGGGDGSVYRIAPNGKETILHSFTGPPADGNLPMGRLTADAKGNLYGVTARGGANDIGTIFKLSPAGHYTLLYSFTNGADGGFPAAGLLRGPRGTFYGTTLAGGASGDGTVFQFTP